MSAFIFSAVRGCRFCRKSPYLHCDCDPWLPHPGATRHSSPANGTGGLRKRPHGVYAAANPSSNVQAPAEVGLRDDCVESIRARAELPFLLESEISAALG